VIIKDWLADELGAKSPEALRALPRIYVSSRHVDEATFIRAYKSVDALVIPTHGEGWGRPQMEVGGGAGAGGAARRGGARSLGRRACPFCPRQQPSCSGIMPHRCPACPLPLPSTPHPFQAMAMGLPVISTNW
jgi:glycosyltransferase involved in cell wall biosynthesis